MNWLLVSVFSITFVLLILSFLFSGAEIGLTLISRSQVNKLKIDSNKRAKIIDRLLSKKELTIGTIQHSEIQLLILLVPFYSH